MSPHLFKNKIQILTKTYTTISTFASVWFSYLSSQDFSFYSLYFSILSPKCQVCSHFRSSALSVSYAWNILHYSSHFMERFSFILPSKVVHFIPHSSIIIYCVILLYITSWHLPSSDKVCLSVCVSERERDREREREIYEGSVCACFVCCYNFST